MNKENLDLILVPVGLFIMVVYHLNLLYRYRYYREKTINGFEKMCKEQWVESMMELKPKDRTLAVTVCNSNVTAATSLASISLVLSSLIGAWLAKSDDNVYTSRLIYGDTRPATQSVKYIALLSFFLIAFACFVQTARCFVHANFLISMPDFGVSNYNVKREVTVGSHFWSVGVRALYFAMTLLMWVFGPIPMIVSSVVMVAMLYVLDTNWSLEPFNPKRDDGSEQMLGTDANTNLEGQAKVDLGPAGLPDAGQVQSFSVSIY